MGDGWEWSEQWGGSKIQLKYMHVVYSRCKQKFAKFDEDRLRFSLAKVMKLRLRGFIISKLFRKALVSISN